MRTLALKGDTGLLSTLSVETKLRQKEEQVLKIGHWFLLQNRGIARILDNPMLNFVLAFLTNLVDER